MRLDLPVSGQLRFSRIHLGSLYRLHPRYLSLTPLFWLSGHYTIILFSSFEMDLTQSVCNLSSGLDVGSLFAQQPAGNVRALATYLTLLQNFRIRVYL